MANNYALPRRKQRVSGRFSKWLTRTFLDEKLYNWFGCLLLGIVAAGFGYLLAKQDAVGMSLLLLVLGLCAILPCFASGATSLYFILIYNYFIYIVPRLLEDESIKVGIGYDALLIIAMLGFVLRREHLKKASNHLFQTPVMIWTLVLYFYNAIELVNPLAHSLTGWYISFRVTTESFLLFFIAYQVFTTWKRIDDYLLMLFWASFLVAIYGCIQQWHGMFPFEMHYISRIKGTSLYYAGQIRKFSTTSGPTAFGMDMAGVAVLYIILGLNEKRRRRQVLYFFGVIVMILSSTYSGTRTSNIMLIAGLAVYVLLQANKKQTRMFAGVAICLLLVIIRLPIYSNATLNRFRSSFEGKHDDSYLVREVNRKRIQPYIYSHPIGGGLGTTNAAGVVYNPGHYLANFQTDDGYLKTALEIGWIGLLITVILYFQILRTGVTEYFNTTNERNKSVLAACLACLFSFMLADLAQEGINEITNVVIYYPAVAILLRLNYVS
ncbi:MAG TPA: O-antigen ligase family protein [Puia sp.]|jgi:putative inorganic carbon (HCO3(-)) transporter|nr:O-antigen ligase family protein [Puia sp.]